MSSLKDLSAITDYSSDWTWAPSQIPSGFYPPTLTNSPLSSSLLLYPDYYSEYKSALNGHTRDKRGGGPPLHVTWPTSSQPDFRPRYVCTECSPHRDFTIKSALDRHTRYKHGGGPPLHVTWPASSQRHRLEQPGPMARYDVVTCIIILVVVDRSCRAFLLILVKRGIGLGNVVWTNRKQIRSSKDHENKKKRAYGVFVVEQDLARRVLSRTKNSSKSNLKPFIVENLDFIASSTFTGAIAAKISGSPLPKLSGDVLGEEEREADIVDTGWFGVKSRLGENSRRDGFRKGRHTKIQTTRHVKGVGGWGENASDDGRSEQDARFPNRASPKRHLSGDVLGEEEREAGIVDTGWFGVKSRLGENSRRDGFRKGRHTKSVMPKSAMFTDWSLMSSQVMGKYSLQKGSTVFEICEELQQTMRYRAKREKAENAAMREYELRDTDLFRNVVFGTKGF
ncbi:hypothetical protein BDZ89DRAFT_1041984 [Hymenopellis radicata]|nr:hypothetical protein BDZ89DRAFT_1041984 [Hymenopellis radicata]